VKGRVFLEDLDLHEKIILKWRIVGFDAL